ncbi:YdcF family protein [Nitratireductor aquimarinus]|uniref:YdcF family protein n=1 Tax=Nitratireductor TaxID=245876 RepID=UPI0019D335B2|nr:MULTISPECIES: YdcF family protein [Nitratireductor]MBN7776867.1 YdcF family protein [Nitratireductor pacificus]MBN7780201.1 YdcF family protein [Nitratireductor pacificus]MBN7789008.1 YdcF family protein [Nitratireductor aquimarinus]MBY6099076.1 YdcF family protein [Nitratireductor aquimarinus]MCA1260682.1 YdcF family protein [Nitratireductor aquimarinus]
MFHFVSAIGWLFLQPLGLAAILIAVSVVTAFFGWRRLSMTAGGLSFIVLFLSAWTTLGALLLGPLEDRFQKPDPVPETVHGIVVLGGGLEGSINSARGGHELNASGDRFVETAILARRFPQAKILISGGQGAVFLAGEGDADTAPRLLTALGVDPERLILENRSRDTYENARFSSEMVQPAEGETWLLVTSAFHMPRAVGVFRKAGFPVTPWPVDYKTAGNEKPGLAEDNALDSLRNLTVGIREWLGLVAYWFAGRTDVFLPASDTRTD